MRSLRIFKNAYFRLQENPYHSSLRFKRVHTDRPIYSVRITRDYRATGVLDDDTMVWFWIGSHTEYERLLEKPVK